MKLPLKLAPLLAAAVLAATAPSAAAECACPVAEGLVGEATGLVDRAAGDANEAAATVLAAVGDEAEDLDADRVPDAVEPLLCGNDFVLLLINQESVPGHCATRTDYLPPGNLDEALDFAEFFARSVEEAILEAERQATEVQREVEEVVGFVESQVYPLYPIWQVIDQDGDRVPDLVEPLVCVFVENQSLPDRKSVV